MSAGRTPEPAPPPTCPPDALVLAAGRGSRLIGFGGSKPLARVRGVALLELCLRQLAAAGVRRAVVVTGHEAGRVEAALPSFAARAGIVAQTVRLAQWDRPNGYSVIAGAARITGNYLLVMADHVFCRGVLDRLVRGADRDAAVSLAVDRRLANPLVDPEDATWVRMAADGRITRIGKGISGADAVDCGAFLATPALAEAIARAIAAGRPGSLSDGMQHLADQGRAATVDIGANWWIDVDDARAHRLAEAFVAAALPEVFATKAAAGAHRIDGGRGWRGAAARP